MGWFPHCCSTSIDLHKMNKPLLPVFTFILMVLCLCFNHQAKADYPAEAYFKSSFSSLFPNRTYVSHQSTCDYQLDYMNKTVNGNWPAASHPFTITGTAPNNCIYKHANSSTTINYGSIQYKICNGVQMLYTDAPTGMCAGDPPPPSECLPLKGQSVTYKSVASTGANQCLDGCEVSMTSGDCGTNSAGENMCFYEGLHEGRSCAGAPPTEPPLSPEFNCISSGQSYGTVNGVVVCLKKGTTGSAPITTTKPPSTTTVTAAPTAGNPNPSPVTTIGPSTTVTQGGPDGKVTETKSNADGSQTSTTASKDDFCASSPNSKLCRQQSACDENPNGPECKHFCEQFPDTIACSSPTEIIGELSDVPALDIQQVTKDDDLSFSIINLPSDNGCPANIIIPNHGYAINISYDWLCSYASAFKSIVVAFALYLASLMIFSALKSQQG
jgi:hypothetical protein